MKDSISTNPISIEFMREQIIKLTNAYCIKSNYKLSPQETDMIASCVIIDWLYNWLKNDKNASQTLRSFSIKKYISKDELKRQSLVETEQSLAKYYRLRDANMLFDAMSKARAKQYENESEMKHPEEPTLTRKGTDLSFLKLRFLDLVAENQDALFRLMLLRKDAFVVSSDKGSNISLKNAYETYNSIFAEIKEMQDPKEYVIACLQIHIFEVSNRFHFFAKMAKYMHDHNILVSCPSTFNASYFIGRYDPSLEIADSYDILNYDRVVQAIFSNNKEAFIKQGQIRHALYAIKKMWLGLFPTELFPSWNMTTYKDAMAFFKNHFPIAETYMPVIFEEKGKDENSTHNKLISLYELLPTLSEYREQMKNYRKK